MAQLEDFAVKVPFVSKDLLEKSYALLDRTALVREMRNQTVYVLLDTSVLLARLLLILQKAFVLVVPIARKGPLNQHLVQWVTFQIKLVFPNLEKTS